MTIWVRTPAELEAFAASLAGCRALAVDIEADSLHHYFEKVCLLQIATDRGDARLVDPLALGDLSPLAPVFADARVVKVFHGADYDIASIKRDFGFAVAGLVDTLIAARFAGARELGLAALVRTELGVELSKASQKDDWSRRPLSPRQEAYALADVQHLLLLARRLLTRVETLGRGAWAREEFAALSAIEPARRQRDPDAYLRIKGASRLSARELARLRAAHGWREARAEATDTPPFKLIGNDELYELAQRPPASPAETAARIERHPRMRAHAEALWRAFAAVEALAEPELPAPPPPPRRPSGRGALQRRIDALKQFRSQWAERAGLDAALVLPQRLIDRVAEAAPRTLDDLAAIPGLRRWRIEAFGEALLAPP